MNATGKFAWPEALIGAGVLALAGVVLGETATAPRSPAYAQVGPQAFPYAVGAGLALLGALLLADGVRGGWRDAAAERALGRPALGPFLWVALGLLVNAAAIQWLGFVLASTALFACIARGFGSRRVVRDVAWGSGLSLVAYLGFAKLLSIRLGDGLIERLL